MNQILHSSESKVGDLINTSFNATGVSMRICPAAANLKQKFSAAVFFCAMFSALAVEQVSAQQFDAGPSNAQLAAQGMTRRLQDAKFFSSSSKTAPSTSVTYPNGWTFCANDGGVCWFPGTVKDVAYGNQGNFLFVLNRQDNFSCTNSAFSDADPLPSITKHCWYSTGPSRLATAHYVASDGGSFNVTGMQTVYYGGDGFYVSKTYGLTDASDITRTATCNATEFGSDPNPGQTKFCLVTNR